MSNEWKELNSITEVVEAIVAGMEIENQLYNLTWETWREAAWYADRNYRARPRKPAMKRVKSICWRHREGYLSWVDEGYGPFGPAWKRFPAGDISGEVEA